MFYVDLLLVTYIGNLALFHINYIAIVLDLDPKLSYVGLLVGFPSISFMMNIQCISKNVIRYPTYFLNNSVRRQPILMKFGRQYYEETRYE